MNTFKFLPFLFFLIGCSSQPNNIEEVIPFDEFSQFPNCGFEDLTLGMPLDSAEKNLEKLGYTSVNPSTFEKEGFQVFLPESDQLSSIKIILTDPFYVDERKEDFIGFLGKYADDIVNNNSFSVYSYQLDKFRFKLTLYEEVNYLRLQIILTSAP